MAKADILVPDQYRDDVLSALHRESIVELRDVRKDEVKGKELLDKAQEHPEAVSMEALHGRVGKIRRIMYLANPPAPAGVMALLTPSPDNRVKTSLRPRPS